MEKLPFMVATRPCALSVFDPNVFFTLEMTEFNTHFDSCTRLTTYLLRIIESILENGHDGFDHVNQYNLMGHKYTLSHERV